MLFKRPIASLCFDLLNGKTVSIKTGFKSYGITNIPREISRAVEKKFDIVIDRKQINYTTEYGFSGYYFEYKLDISKQKKKSICKIYDYIKKNKVKIKR